MVDNFETVNSEDLSRLVEMHEQPSGGSVASLVKSNKLRGDLMDTALEPVQFTQSQEGCNFDYVFGP